MTTIDSFVNRLDKIGIKVELIGNWPWVYLHKVNGVVITNKMHSNHGFTVFFKAIETDRKDTITDISAIFKQIREVLDESKSKGITEKGK